MKKITRHKFRQMVKMQLDSFNNALIERPNFIIFKGHIMDCYPIKESEGQSSVFVIDESRFEACYQELLKTNVIDVFVM